MRKNSDFILLCITLGIVIVLASCGGSSGDSPSSSPDVPEAVRSAQKMLAEKTSLPVKSIQVKNYQTSTWPNDCLGFPLRGEECLPESVNGYQGVLLAGNEQVEFHADQLGEQVRLIPQAAIKARDTLARQTGVAQDEIQFLAFDEVDWADACLEIVQPGVACNPVTTPGYFIQLSAGGIPYEFHTDQTGNLILQAQKAP